MRRRLALLLLALCLLPGCGKGNAQKGTVTRVSAEDCFVCENCLEHILPEKDAPTGLGAVDLLTGEVRALDRKTRGFFLGDFYIHCDWKKDGTTAELFLFYSPLRYVEKR